MNFFKTEYGELINLKAVSHIRPEGDQYKVSFNGASSFYITENDFDKISLLDIIPEPRLTVAKDNSRKPKTASIAKDKKVKEKAKKK